MKKRLIISTILAAIILLSVISYASAITGRLGNSRVVLRLDVGEEARRNLVIENINDVPLVIELIVSGDLADNVKFEENSFTLQPGESKQAYFTIKTNNPGTTETKINVMFKPPTGAGVGLSASVIVIAGGEAIEETESGTEDETSEDTAGSGFSFTPSPTSVTEGESNSFTLSPIAILTISTIVLIVIFLILLVYSGKLNRKKRSRRPRE